MLLCTRCTEAIVLNQLKQISRFGKWVGLAFCKLGIAGVLVIALTGCNELALQDDSVTHDAVESWATPLRAPAASKTDETQGKKKKHSGESYFFNQKSREIEKSLGL